jgi:hypothetical protein
MQSIFGHCLVSEFFNSHITITLKTSELLLWPVASICLHGRDAAGLIDLRAAMKALLLK